MMLRRCSDISFKILGVIALVPGDLSVFSWRRHFLSSSSVMSNVVGVSVVRFFGVPCGMLVVSSFVNVLKKC